MEKVSEATLRGWVFHRLLVPLGIEQLCLGKFPTPPDQEPTNRECLAESCRCTRGY